jgi:hypothetical protein
MTKALTIFILVSLSVTSIAHPQHTIEGVILSQHDSVAVAFASVYIDQQAGTIANEDGYFKLTSDRPIKEITVTHVNYETLRVFADDRVTGFQKIYLSEKSFQLDAITVSGNTAETEIKLAIKRSSAAVVLPVSIKGYYSEFVTTNGQYEKFADGIIQYYLPKDYDDPKSIDAKVVASRAVDLKPEGEIDLDMVSPVGVRFTLRNYNISRIKKFLDSLSFDEYKYVIMSTEDDDENVVIRFSPKQDRKKILFEGVIHINKANNLIRFIDYKIAEETLAYSRETNVVVLKAKIVSGRGTIMFGNHPDSGIYSMLYIREEFGLRIFNKRIDQVNVFTQQFQVLEVKPASEKPLKRSEEYSKKALYKNGTKYTDKFWEAANLIQATKEEEEIVKKVSAN